MREPIRWHRVMLVVVPLAVLAYAVAHDCGWFHGLPTVREWTRTMLIVSIAVVTGRNWFMASRGEW